MPVGDVIRRLLWPVGPGAFRLWLALVVVLHHFVRIDFGQASVFVFFVLSGYWVQKTWNARYIRTSAPWLTFVVSRWWRIAPMVMIATPLSLAAYAYAHYDLAGALVKEGGMFAFSSVFLLLYNSLDFKVIGPAWSLDIEMQFYLIAPLLCWLSGRISPALLVAVGAMVSFYSLLHLPRSMLNDFFFFFAVGMASARADWQPGKPLAFVSAALTVGLVIGILCSPWHSVIDEAGGFHGYFFLFNWLLACLAVPFAVFTVRQRVDQTDHLMADLSFLTYLLHWPAIIVFRAMSPASGAVEVARALALFIATVSVCLLARRTVDQPLNALRSRWVAARRIGVEADRAGEASRVPEKTDDSAALFA